MRRYKSKSEKVTIVCRHLCICFSFGKNDFSTAQREKILWFETMDSTTQ